METMFWQVDNTWGITTKKLICILLIVRILINHQSPITNHQSSTKVPIQTMSSSLTSSLNLFHIDEIKLIATAENYLGIRKFVKENIVPDELSEFENVITKYAQILINNLFELKARDQPINLNYLIHICSPFAPYIDSGASAYMNGGTSTLESISIDEELKEALESEGFKFDYELKGGF